MEKQVYYKNLETEIWQYDLPQLTLPDIRVAGEICREHKYFVVRKLNNDLEYNKEDYDKVYNFMYHCHLMVWRYLASNDLIEQFNQGEFLYYDVIEQSAPWLLDWMPLFSRSL